VCVSAHTAFTSTFVYSSYLTQGKISCDPARTFPEPVPQQAWSAQRISSTCTGSGRLRLSVRHGRAEAVSPDDCLIAEREQAFDYSQADQPLELPPLDAWSAQDPDCASAYEQDGGYLEFRIESGTLGCGEADAKVTYVNICPLRCDGHPEAPGCEVCGGPSVANRL
jgi:hypothetical protein